MKKTLQLLKFIPFFILIFFVFMFFAYRTANNETQICFPDKCITAEIAKTPEEKRIGLMLREFLPENRGMLFVYEKEEHPNFWMKNTLVPLDIIWIDSDYKINQIITAHPCKIEDCEIYPAKYPSQYVLEVNAGFSEKNRIKEGDSIQIKNSSQ